MIPPLALTATTRISGACLALFSRDHTKSRRDLGPVFMALREGRSPCGATDQATPTAQREWDAPITSNPLDWSQGHRHPRHVTGAYL